MPCLRKANRSMYVISKPRAGALERAFLKMGARVKIGEPEISRTARFFRPYREDIRPFELDVRRDRDGGYFLVRKRADVNVEILEVQPRDRHLVLLARVPESSGYETKSRFLLGHDERHWFVAAIPEQNPVSTVAAAKQALKPDVVLLRENRVRARVRNRRVNKARVRQGEWFFVPATDLRVVPGRILKNEPLRRGGGKPHVCQELYRVGGETVYVNRAHPNGLTQAEFARLSDKVRAQPGWTRMARNPRAFVRGTVRHSDHKTIVLEGWHEVLMNTEILAAAMRNVAFLD
jgi:hypothetical protein